MWGRYRVSPRFKSTRLSVGRLLRLVPRGGCLLVFNGVYASWTTQAYKTKVLNCYTADPGGRQKFQKVRDLYVCWKEEAE